MANFHDTLVLNKYMLSLFGINSIGKKIIGKNGIEIFAELKHSINEGYTDEGNTKYLQTLLSHLYLTEKLTANMLQEYDENIVRHTKQISEDRTETIQWKYFQYLSLLFTEIYLDKYFANPVQLREELNAYVNVYNRCQAEEALAAGKKKAKEIFQANPFTLQSLNKLAFWNATGSGKTLLMHINIKQYLYYAHKHGQQHQTKVLLITPNEGLSKQHLEEFKLSGIRANIFSKTDTQGMYANTEVEVLEITKLADSSGDRTVAVESFETDNLVLIDEGHGGMSGDSWKRYRDKLSETGFAFEYSATFGQAINAAAGKKKSDFTQEYAKSILFDYSYKYFYEDGYGKDYRILNLKDDHHDYRKLYLTANLLAFYQQQLIYKDKKDTLRDFLLHKPLWVFVGGKVNAVRNEGGKKISDVLEIIDFLNVFLKHTERSVKQIADVVSNKAGLVDKNGYAIFETSFSYIADIDALDIFKGINQLIFNNHTLGAGLYLDNLKGADGELGLRVGDSEYFGVINVGDEKTLYDLAKDNGVLGNDRELSESLFKKINHDTSSVNLLIGSKKFTEGWSSWRVSSMGLMNVGKSEGSQIIQLFGRGVRLKGYNFSLKRSSGLDEYQKPDDIRNIRIYLRHLETLQIFGVQANYMEQFKEFLEEEGLPANDSSWISIKVPTIKRYDAVDRPLKLIRIADTGEFKTRPVHLKLDLAKFQGKMVELDWYPKIDVMEKSSPARKGDKESGTLNTNHLQLIDRNALYLALQTFKADKGYSNLVINMANIDAILASPSWYRILIQANRLAFTDLRNIAIWQELAEALLKRYAEQLYLFHKYDFGKDHIEAVVLADNDENFITEYDIRINTNEDTHLFRSRIEELQLRGADDSFKQIVIGSEAEAFDNILHLYKPLVYLGKNFSDRIQVSPIALDASEKLFLYDLITYVQTHPQHLAGKEVRILRNQSKKGLGFFTDGNNFYPDFILWIVEGERQHIKFIDPKGIRNSKGINDPKIQFYKVLRETIQPQLVGNNIYVDSFIVSNTALLDVQWRNGLTEADFATEHVFFQINSSLNYVELILN